MAKLRNVIASARRSRPALAAGAVALAVIVAGGVVLATQSTPPPAPSPQASTRAIALGDSVPYGHGLANPYRTPQDGLPATAVSQAPSRLAYPSLVAGSLSLTMTIRPDNCTLTGDQLAISGAVAAVLTIHHATIPPTAGYEEPDPEITIQVVHGEPRPWEPSAVLSNSFGFGGHNGCLVFLPPTS